MAEGEENVEFEATSDAEEVSEGEEGEELRQRNRRTCMESLYLS